MVNQGLSLITYLYVINNLTSAFFDHLQQILFVPSILSDQPSSKLNIYQKNWTKFNKEDFILDYFEKDRLSVLVEMILISHSIIFLMNANELFDKHAP